MFICNIKVNGSKVFKIFVLVIAILVAFLFLFITWKIFYESHLGKVNDRLNLPSIAQITTDNYTDILKAVHENLDNYIGQKICFSGYIYRAIDFTEEEFVLARDMVVSSNSETLIVGFLCHSDKISNIPDNTWVEITGTIKKGTYHSEIPIIYVTELKKIEKPADEFVYPPDDTYIPTSVLF